MEAVEPRGPAAEAGLVSGDRILTIDGKPAKGDVEEMQNASIRPVGSAITIEFNRALEKKRTALKIFRAL